MPKRRDSQKSKLYKAEDEARGTPGSGEHRFESIEQAQAWVNEIICSRWFRTREWGKDVNVVAVYRQGRRGASTAGSYWSSGGGWTGNIHLMENHVTKFIVLHELSHVLTESRPAHGRRFVKLYMALVKRFIGRPGWLLLRAAFVKHHVHWKLCRKQPGKLPPWVVAAKEKVDGQAGL
jgi:putative metallohydrolase (TIGR04338 family)